MRVCDACYLSGPMTVVAESKIRLTGSGYGNSKYVWPAVNGVDQNPEFCECYAFFQAKDWTSLGKRQAESMGRMLKSATRKKPAPKPRPKPTVEDNIDGKVDA